MSGEKIVVSEDPHGPEHSTGEFLPLVVIDIDDLREDMRDPQWQDFLQRAVAYRRRLREAGKLG